MFLGVFQSGFLRGALALGRDPDSSRLVLLPQSDFSSMYGVKEVRQWRGVNEGTTLHVGSASLESEDLTACLPTVRGNDVSLDSVPSTKQW